MLNKASIFCQHLIRSDSFDTSSLFAVPLFSFRSLDESEILMMFSLHGAR